MKAPLSFLVMNCRDATMAVEKEIHKSLSIWHKIRLSLHLSLCRVCASYSRQSRLIEKLLKKSNARDKNLSQQELAELKVKIQKELGKNGLV